MASHSIVVDNVSYTYAEKSVPALDGVSISIPKGARLLVLGENGSGKSTLLRMLSGLHKPSHGKATVLGRDSFLDTTLNRDVARVGSTWSQAVKWPSTVDSHVSLERDIDADRFAELMGVLSINRSWRIDKISDGQRRRVQILLGILHKKEVILLDECSNDIDAVDRIRILDFLKKESTDKGATAIYATHILDGMKDWATHVAVLSEAKLVYYEPIEKVDCTSLHEFATRWIERPHCAEIDPSVLQVDGVPAEERVVRGVNLSYRYEDNELLKGANFEVPAGSRVLVVGRNGCGKSTLLRLTAGVNFAPKNALYVGSKQCFHDASLGGVLSLSGGWWEEGQPEWDLEVSEMVHATKLDDLPPLARGLADVLGIDLKWRVRSISAGQRKRVQLLLTLMEKRAVLLLDEATADLDVVQRRRLLEYLRMCSEAAGITVLYCTHIFEDMYWWPSHVMIVSKRLRQVQVLPWGPTSSAEEFMAELRRDDVV
eukprot:PhM_4_TR12476/c0_g1_i1/m.22641/K12608/CAF16; CCR4-NOT complex subunit CAF16